MDTNNNIETISVSQKRVWKWYLILSIIYAAIAILSTMISFLVPDLALPTLELWDPFVRIWCLFEIVMLTLIISKDIEKVAIWLPSLSIFDFIFTIILTRIVYSVGGLDGFQNPFIWILFAVFPAIALFIAIKLFLRK